MSKKGKAKPKTKRSSGPLTEILTEWTPENVTSLTEAELRGIVNKMASAANKRLKRAEQTGRTKLPAYQSRVRENEDTAARFSTKGLDTNALRHEFKLAYNYLNDVTSTAKGYDKRIKELNDQFYSFTGIEVDEMGSDAVKAFYRAISKFRELYPSKQAEMYDMVKMAEFINASDEYKNSMGVMSEDEIDSLSDKLFDFMEGDKDRLYEEAEEERWRREQADFWS